MSDMKTTHSQPSRPAVHPYADQRGALNVLVLPLIMLFLAFLGAVGFAFWAFAGRQDYKTNSDKKVATAVATAEQQQQQTDAKTYAEQAKQPFNSYIGPSAFGNIILKYPKTWSAYVVVNQNNNGLPIDGYFHPNYVPDVTSQSNNFALRVQVVQQSYDNVLNQFTGQIQQKQVTAQPYSLPKVPSVVGSRLEGQIGQNKQGVMIVLPLRNMTMKIWTEAADYKADLDNSILPNFTFQP